MNRNPSFNPSLSANIPTLITNLDQWLVWKSQPRIGQDSKFTKVPYNLRTALPSDPTSADTWTTFDQAIQATGYDGIGFAINQSIGLLLIDLDNCILDGVACEAPLQHGLVVQKMMEGLLHSAEIGKPVSFE